MIGRLTSCQAEVHTEGGVTRLPAGNASQPTESGRGDED